jgi:hypothetical protein
MTLHSPLQSPLPPPRHKSKGPLLILLISLPIILAAAYFLFFQDILTFTRGAAHDVNRAKTPPPISADKEKTAGEKAAGEKTPGEKTPGEQEAAGDKNDTDEQYSRLAGRAEQYFEEQNYEQALETVNKALGIKETPELKTLENKINQQLDLAKEKGFMKYYTQARNAYTSGNFKKARDNIREARKYKSESNDLVKLEQDIEAAEIKKAERDKKARLAAERRRRIQKRDDNAFSKAKSANTMHAFEKYLKNYPKGRHAAEAKKKFDDLKQAIVLEDKIKDDTLYADAANTNTISAYENYLNKFPYGLHVRDARVKINQLKEKTLRETKIPVELRRIRFFESGKTMTPRGRRTYTARFAAAGTRYIYTEIAYDNKLYRIADRSSRVTIHYSVFDQELRGTINLDSSARNGIYSRGMGYSEAGKWPAGSYTVTVYLDGQKIGQSQFVVE